MPILINEATPQKAVTKEVKPAYDPDKMWIGYIYAMMGTLVQCLNQFFGK